MDVSSLVTTAYTEVSSDTQVSKVVSAFDDPSCRGVVVADGDGYDGVITRRRLARSHQPPEQKAGSLTWPAPRISPREDVRDAAQLMLDGDVRLLPVFENQQLTGVVTANDLLDHVQEYLEAATVADAYTPELVTVQPETTVGEAIHRFREHDITHLPVVDEGTVRGMLTLYDIMDLAARKTDRPQGGNTPGFDAHGGKGSSQDYRSHGGQGAREGEQDRLLDLPVRDRMSRPAHTIDRSATLEEAVGEMFDAEASSLVVGEDGRPGGIVTKTDVLESLTWSAEGHRAVQVNGTEYIDDMTYQDIVDMVEELERKAGDLEFHDVRFHINKHQERRRGTPLLFVRARIATNEGLITASEEGYGASRALNEVEDILKRRIRDENGTVPSKKHPDEEFWEKRFGWFLSE